MATRQGWPRARRRVRPQLDAAGQGAVHHEVGAAHPAGHRAGQEDHGRRDLLGGAHVPRRVEAHGRREELRVTLLDVGPDAVLEVGVARGHRVGPDAVVGQLHREPVDVADDGGLGGAVRPGGEVRLAARDAGDGDDRRGVAALQVRHRGPDQPHRVHEVDVEAGQPVLLGVREREGADVRHHDVQPAERRRRAVHPRGDAGPVGDVHDRAQQVPPATQRLLGRGDLLLAPGTEPDDRPLVEEGLDDGAADAARASGDEHPLAGEPEVHGVRLLVGGADRCRVRAVGRGPAGRRGCRRRHWRPAASTWAP